MYAQQIAITKNGVPPNDQKLALALLYCLALHSSHFKYLVEVYFLLIYHQVCFVQQVGKRKTKRLYDLGIMVR